MNLLEVAVLSERRRDMLLLIEKKPRSLEELEGSLDISSASIKHHIKKLVISRLLVVESGKYELSEMAVPIIRNLEELLDLLTFFEKNMDYWKIHDLTPIPDFLKKRLGELGRFEFVERDSVYMFEIPGIILKSLRESKDIFTFSLACIRKFPMYIQSSQKKA